MKKILKLTGLALLSSGILFSTVTLAQMNKDERSDRSNCEKQHKSSQGEHRGLGKMKHALQGLDLTEAQQSEVKAIMADAKSTMKSMHKTMKSSREKLHSRMNNSDYDADAIKQAANEQANLVAQQIMFRAQTKAEIFKILSAEQQQQLTDKLESRKHH